MPQTNNALTIAPSTNAELSAVLIPLHDRLMEAASNSILSQHANEGYTAMELRAMTHVEALRLLNGFDLATIIERGHIIHDIDQQGLVGVFPGDYGTLEQIAADVGVSSSEVSDTRVLCETIFPWIENNTGQTVAYWWDRIGKSKFREMVPVLKALITGEIAVERGTVAQSIELLLDQTQADATASGEGQLADDVLHTRAIERVLEFGTLPVREMRQRMRPVHTPNIPGVRISHNRSTYVVLKVDEEQNTMLSRLLGTHAEITPVDDGGQVGPALGRLRL
jgi:hypothetical protein